MEQLCDFKCYDSKKNRLAVFGREKDGTLEVFVLRCNKGDEFSKMLAKHTYATYLQHSITDKTLFTSVGYFHPTISTVPIEPGDSVKYTFKKYCVNNFYKKQNKIVLQDVLRNIRWR